MSGWVEGVLGPVRIEPAPVSSAQATLSRVWRGDTLVAWVKRYPAAGRAAHEVRAYERWGTAMGAPSLLGVSPDRRELLVSHAAGVNLAEIPAGDVLRVGVCHALGLRLKRLHALPVASDPLPVHEALVMRAEAWAARAVGVVPDDAVAEVVARVRASDAGPRVPCHRDVRPEHVVVAAGGIVLIDLGQARADVAAADLVKLVELPDVLADDEVAALWAGLGGPPPALDAMVALHALMTWVWSASRGDVAGALRGEAVLRRALGGGGTGGDRAW